MTPVRAICSECCRQRAISIIPQDIALKLKYYKRLEGCSTRFEHPWQFPENSVTIER